ncbi:MAG: hypothetical protein SNJ59_03910 [Aggregatilineales bacterium]
MTEKPFNHHDDRFDAGMDETFDPGANAAVNAEASSAGAAAGASQTPEAPPPPVAAPANRASRDNRYEERLERLGGEPAPAITPEEFARLQRAGQVHIDARGRVHTTRRTDAEAGVSLRKRRAWYV